MGEIKVGQGSGIIHEPEISAPGTPKTPIPPAGSSVGPVDSFSESERSSVSTVAKSSLDATINKFFADASASQKKIAADHENATAAKNIELKKWESALKSYGNKGRIGKLFARLSPRESLGLLKKDVQDWNGWVKEQRKSNPSVGHTDYLRKKITSASSDKTAVEGQWGAQLLEASAKLERANTLLSHLQTLKAQAPVEGDQPASFAAKLQRVGEVITALKTPEAKLNASIVKLKDELKGMGTPAQLGEGTKDQLDRAEELRGEIKKLENKRSQITEQEPEHSLLARALELEQELESAQEKLIRDQREADLKTQREKEIRRAQIIRDNQAEVNEYLNNQIKLFLKPVPANLLTDPKIIEVRAELFSMREAYAQREEALSDLKSVIDHQLGKLSDRLMVAVSEAMEEAYLKPAEQEKEASAAEATKAVQESLRKAAELDQIFVDAERNPLAQNGTLITNLLPSIEYEVREGNLTPADAARLRARAEVYQSAAARVQMILEGAAGRAEIAAGDDELLELMGKMLANSKLSDPNFRAQDLLAKIGGVSDANGNLRTVDLADFGLKQYAAGSQDAEILGTKAPTAGWNLNVQEAKLLKAFLTERVFRLRDRQRSDSVNLQNEIRQRLQAEAEKDLEQLHNLDRFAQPQSAMELDVQAAVNKLKANKRLPPEALRNRGDIFLQSLGRQAAAGLDAKINATQFLKGMGLTQLTFSGYNFSMYTGTGTPQGFQLERPEAVVLEAFLKQRNTSGLYDTELSQLSKLTGVVEQAPVVGETRAPASDEALFVRVPVPRKPGPKTQKKVQSYKVKPETKAVAAEPTPSQKQVKQITLLQQDIAQAKAQLSAVLEARGVTYTYEQYKAGVDLEEHIKNLQAQLDKLNQNH